MKKIIALLLLAGMILTVLCSCNNTDEKSTEKSTVTESATPTEQGTQKPTENTSPEQPTETPTETPSDEPETIAGIILSGKYDKIVIPSDPKLMENILADTLLTKLTKLDPDGDYSLVNDTEEENDNEIIIGVTNRPLSSSADEKIDSADTDFVISENQGKIIIYAKSKIALREAVTYFIDNLKVAKDGTVYYTKTEQVVHTPLSFDTIKTLLSGVVRTKEKENGLVVYRSTEAEENAWGNLGTFSWLKQFTVHSTGIKLDFHTNSSRIYFKFANSVTDGGFDLYVDGEYVSTSTGIIDEKFVGKSEKRITIVFPNRLSNAEITLLNIDEGATLSPHTYDKNVLILGDSITHGEKAKLDSNSWANQFSLKSNTNCVIQGFMGSCFQPDTLFSIDGFTPDCVIVAYGINDWYTRSTLDELKQEATEYYQKIRELYPNADIIGITPTWCGEAFTSGRKVCCTLEQLRSSIAEIIKSVNGTVVNGLELVPNDMKYFASDGVHPNDEGYIIYANNLYEKVKDIIQ